MLNAYCIITEYICAKVDLMKIYMVKNKIIYVIILKKIP